MSRGDLQEMEVGTKQSKGPVNANAKAGDPMEKLKLNPGDGLSASVEDLGGPTPENYKPDNDSAKLREPRIKTVSDVVNKGAKAADPMPTMKKEEEDLQGEIVSEEPTVEETVETVEETVSYTHLTLPTKRIV